MRASRLSLVVLVLVRCSAPNEYYGAVFSVIKLSCFFVFRGVTVPRTLHDRFAQHCNANRYDRTHLPHLPRSPVRPPTPLCQYSDTLCQLLPPQINLYLLHISHVHRQPRHAQGGQQGQVLRRCLLCLVRHPAAPSYPRQRALRAPPPLSRIAAARLCYLHRRTATAALDLKPTAPLHMHRDVSSY